MIAAEPERAYLRELVARLRGVLGDELVGVYAGGSLALGDYDPGRSDLDVTAVVREPLPAAAKRELAAAVRHEALPCPARGLELVVYALGAVREATTRAAFELNLNTGAGMAFRADEQPVPGERHWFAIDRSVLREHGIALEGPPAAQVFAAPPAEGLLPVLAGVLRWYVRDGDRADAVLNACRALLFAAEGRWTSKPAAGRWALAQAAARRDEGLVRAALARDPLDEARVTAFLERSAAVLVSGAADAPPRRARRRPRR